MDRCRFVGPVAGMVLAGIVGAGCAVPDARRVAASNGASTGEIDHGSERRHEHRGAVVSAELLGGGAESIAVENAGIVVAVAPEIGGKIVSIRDPRSGREWLWRNPYVRLRAAEPGAAFIDYDLSGWDECFPSVAAISYPEPPWEGVACGDHGQLWCVPWTATVDGNAVVAAGAGRGLPYRFTRVVRLVGDRAAEFAYTVEVDGDDPVQALWAGHALFAAEAGMRIEFPEGTTMRIRSEDSFLGPRDTVFPWPVAPGTDGPVDLGTVRDPMAGWCAKLFTEDLPEPWARLRAPDGATLTLRLDPGLAIGLWLNYGLLGGTGQPPHAKIGLEPTTGRGEHAFEVTEQGDDTTFAGTRSWRVVVELDDAPPEPAAIDATAPGVPRGAN